MFNSPPPITGFIRFSFFGMSDTRQKHRDVDLAHAQIYNPARMEARFYLFENLCLPSLKAQTNPDFRTVILTSKVMPKPYKDRLMDVTADLPNVVIDFSEANNIKAALKPYMFDPDITDRSVNFRLDDDDAISCQYINKLRHLSLQLPERTHISFPKGIITMPNRKGKHTSGVYSQMCIGAGLVRISGQNFRKNPYQMMHGAVWKTFPTIVDPDFVAYIVTLHDHNDTAAQHAVRFQNARAGSYRMGTPDGDAAVQKALALNFPHLTQDRLHDIMADDILAQHADEPEKTH